MYTKEVLQLIYGVQEYEVSDSLIQLVNRSDSFEVVDQGFILLWNLETLIDSEFEQYLRIERFKLFNFLNFLGHYILVIESLTDLKGNNEIDLSISVACLIRYRFHSILTSNSLYCLGSFFSSTSLEEFSHFRVINSNCKISKLKITSYRLTSYNASNASCLSICINCNALVINVEQEAQNSKHRKTLLETWEELSIFKILLIIVTDGESISNCLYCRDNSNLIPIEHLEGSFCQSPVIVEFQDVSSSSVESGLMFDIDSDSDDGLETVEGYLVQEFRSNTLIAVIPRLLWETIDVTSTYDLFGMIDLLKISRKGKLKVRLILKCMGLSIVKPTVFDDSIKLSQIAKEICSLPSFSTSNPDYVTLVMACFLAPLIASQKVRILILDANCTIISFLANICNAAIHYCTPGREKLNTKLWNSSRTLIKDSPTCQVVLGKLFRDSSLLLHDCHNLTKSELIQVCDCIGPQSSTWITSTVHAISLNSSTIVATTLSHKLHTKSMSGILEEFPIWLRDETRFSENVDGSIREHHSTRVQTMLKESSLHVAQWNEDATEYLWENTKKRANELFSCRSVHELNLECKAIIQTYASLEGMSVVTRAEIDQFFTMIQRVRYIPIEDLKGSIELTALRVDLKLQQKKIGHSMGALLTEFTSRLSQLQPDRIYSKSDLLEIAQSVIEDSATSKVFSYQLLTIANENGHILKSDSGYRLN